MKTPMTIQEAVQDALLGERCPCDILLLGYPAEPASYLVVKGQKMTRTACNKIADNFKNICITSPVFNQNFRLVIRSKTRHPSLGDVTIKELMRAFRYFNPYYLEEGERCNSWASLLTGYRMAKAEGYSENARGTFAEYLVREMYESIQAKQYDL